MAHESDLKAPIEQLNLTVKPYNCLTRAGFTNIGDVLARDEEELLALPGFGEWQYQELRDNSPVWACLTAKRLAARNSQQARYYPLLLVACCLLPWTPIHRHTSA
jgi:hypothetical protein